MSYPSDVVPGAGPKPSLVLLCGEAPGREEWARGAPFVGKSGKEQDAYLARHGLNSRQWYRTNTVKLYREGNPDPSPALTRQWTPDLYRELQEVRPKLVVAVGRYAMRWFLGETADLSSCHGIPHKAGAFDPSRRDRGGPNDAVVVPIHHPAGGFYDNDARAVIAYDYEQVARVFKEVKAGREVEIREDEFAGRERYLDVTGEELAGYVDVTGGSLFLNNGDDHVIALDTEGSAEQPWSLQVSAQPGEGMVLRCARPDFKIGIEALQRAADNGAVFAMHQASTPQGCGWDLKVCAAMGLDLTRARLWDTMYAAYLLRLEPQGLKALAYRWCGMRMEDYKRLLGGVGADKQLEYLARIIDHEWPAVEPRLEIKNDGTSSVKTPQHVSKRVERILIDYGEILLKGSLSEDDDSDPDKESDTTDFLYKRWRAMDPPQLKLVESVLGRMPHTTLDDIPLEKAVWYAGRDSDATLRLHYKLKTELEKRGLVKLMDTGMAVLPVFFDMQRTGMPASRTAFVKLRDELAGAMEKLAARISHRYYGGKPFNPKSTKQVAAVLRRRGLVGAKKTAKGAMSTGKQSIEHLRYSDEAVADIIEWREKQHIKDMFCVPTLELMPEDVDVTTVSCKLKVTRTTTRRVASFDPNFLAFPKHEKPGGVDYGKQVRRCFVCPPGEVLLETDFSQIEVRMLAHESADKLLCRMFTEKDQEGNPRDVHTETAALIFGVPAADVTKVQRFFAKRVTFGIAYGVSGSGLATQLRMAGALGWDDQTCDKLIKEWLKLYSGAAAYFDRVEREVVATGFVRDCWGMVRYLPGVWAEDNKLASEARRQAVNHRIQGGAQGLVQNAMAWLKEPVRELQDAGLNVQWVLQVHDALLLRMDEELVEVVQPLVEEGMVRHCGMKLRVPVLVDSHTAGSWGEL